MLLLEAVGRHKNIFGLYTGIDKIECQTKIYDKLRLSLGPWLTEYIINYVMPLIFTLK